MKDYQKLPIIENIEMGLKSDEMDQEFKLAVSTFLSLQGFYMDLTEFSLNVQKNKSEYFFKEGLEAPSILFHDSDQSCHLIQLRHMPKNNIKISELFKGFKGDFSLLELVCYYFRLSNGSRFLNSTLKSLIIVTNASIDSMYNGQGSYESIQSLMNIKTTQKPLRSLKYGITHDIKAVHLDLNNPNSSNDFLFLKSQMLNCYKFNHAKVVDIIFRQAKIILDIEKNVNLQKILKNLTKTNIQQCLDKIIFAVTQPNIIQMNEIIQKEMKEHFKLYNALNLFDRIQIFMKEKFKCCRESHVMINYSSVKSFLENNQLIQVTFQVELPIKSFIGRQAEVKNIRKALVTENSDRSLSKCLLVTGLSGVGKTELVKYFVQKYGMLDYYGRIIWINAERKELMEKSFKNVVHTLKKLTTRITSNADVSVKSDIRDIIRFFKGMKTLFVFDNVTENNPYLNYFRNISNETHIIITSSNFNLLNNVHHTVIINNLSSHEAMSLLQKEVSVATELEIENLECLLNGHPKAIDLAITYIRQRNNFLYTGGCQLKYSMTEYIQELKQVERYTEIYHTYKEHCPVATFSTYSIILNAIKHTKFGFEAFKLLQIISFLDSKCIDPNIFQFTVKLNKSLTQKLIKMFKDCSLVYEDQKGLLSIDPILQKIFRDHYITDHGTILDELTQYIIDCTQWNWSNNQHHVFQILNYLLKHNFLLHKYRNKLILGKFLVHYAAEFNNKIALELLMISGVDVNVRDADKNTSMYYGSKGGHVEMIELLIEAGSDVHSVAQGMECASRNGNLEIVKYLVDVTSAVSSRSDILEIGLHAAVKNGNKDIAECLLNSGANVNAKVGGNETCLILATKEKDYEMIQLLLKMKPDITIKNKEGDTASDISAKLGHLKAVILLIESESDFLMRKKLTNTAIQRAARAGKLRIVEALLRLMDVDVNVIDRYGHTVLIYVVRFNSINLVKMLLHAGANVNKVNRYGQAALHYAAKDASTELVAVLVETGADVNLVNFYDETALHIAARHNRVDTVKCLLEAGADRRLKNAYDELPINCAYAEKNYEVINALLEPKSKIVKYCCCS